MARDEELMPKTAFSPPLGLRTLMSSDYRSASSRTGNLETVGANIRTSWRYSDKKPPADAGTRVLCAFVQHVASPVAARWSSSGGARAPEYLGSLVWCLGSVAPQHVGVLASDQGSNMCPLLWKVES